MWHMRRQRAFSLLELMAVVIIIMILTAVTALTFANSRPSVQMKRDAAHMVSFLRNMWDLSKTSGAPLVLKPDFKKGSFAYEDPRTGKSKKAELSGSVLVIKINDRVHSAASSLFEPPEGQEPVWDEEYGDAIYISEGRGITTISVLLGIWKDEQLTTPTLCTLNLITGKSEVLLLDADALEGLELGEAVPQAPGEEAEDED